MKTTTTRTAYYRPRHSAPYPNCAPRRFSADKLLDTLLAAAITVGSIVALLFLLFLL